MILEFLKSLIIRFLLKKFNEIRLKLFIKKKLLVKKKKIEFNFLKLTKILLKFKIR